ncbi:MAG: glycosyltransferase family 2 protein [Solirubrobacterales bacterium]
MVTCENRLPSTMRMLTRVRPSLPPPIPGLQEMLFLPPNSHRGGEGGLRHRGCFKESRPGVPRITVVTVVRNRVSDIAATIESVLAQSYGPLEYIVIDGASTDGTEDVIRRYEDAIDYWVSEPDWGISDAFNKGLRVATGEWINFMNAGDRFADPDVAGRVARIVDGSLDLVSGRVNLVDAAGRVLYTIGGPYSREQFRRRMTLPHQSVFHNRAYFERYGCFDADLAICMPYELLARKPKLAAGYLPMVVANMLAGGVTETQGLWACSVYRAVKRKYFSDLSRTTITADYWKGVVRYFARRLLTCLGLGAIVRRYRALRAR